MNGRQAHWDRVYTEKAPTEVSWHQANPGKSLEWIYAAQVQPADPIIDVGGGASLLIEALLAAGYQDLTVLDISEEVLRKLGARLSNPSVSLLHQDVTTFQPERRYALWHDRAVFHFLVRREDRESYIKALRLGLADGGHLIMATFGSAGPERCSGLPVVRYDAGGLAGELGTDFELIDSCEELHRTPWDSTQQFLYCRFRRNPSGA